MSMLKCEACKNSTNSKWRLKLKNPQWGIKKYQENGSFLEVVINNDNLLLVEIDKTSYKTPHPPPCRPTNPWINILLLQSEIYVPNLNLLPQQKEQCDLELDSVSIPASSYSLFSCSCPSTFKVCKTFTEKVDDSEVSWDIVFFVKILMFLWKTWWSVLMR